MGRMASRYSFFEILLSPSLSICLIMARTSPWTLIGFSPRAKPTSSGMESVPLPSRSMWSNARSSISARDRPSMRCVGRGASSFARRTSWRTTSLFAVHPRRWHEAKYTSHSESFESHPATFFFAGTNSIVGGATAVAATRRARMPNPELATEHW